MPKSRRICVLALLGPAALWAQVTAHYINVGQAAAALVEFKSGAILIDAGGEKDDKTLREAYRAHLLAYLADFFKQRPELENTLDAIIVTHPHSDHTLYLMDVMQRFALRTLVDNGGEKGSGADDLKNARLLAKQRRIQYVSVGDAGIRKRGTRLALIDGEDPAADPDILLLAGFRGCDDENNDSIAVRVRLQGVSLLFPGDADRRKDPKCGAPELSLLSDRFPTGALLRADVYEVAHHGSEYGTTEPFIKAVAPRIAVISAGDPAPKKGKFNAYAFGHPREDIVGEVEKSTTGTRDPVEVVTFSAVRTPAKRTISQAVYCTCWDGDVIVSYAAGETTPAVRTTAWRAR